MPIARRTRIHRCSILLLALLLLPVSAGPPASARPASAPDDPAEIPTIINATGTMTFFVSEAPYHPVGGFESQVLAGPGKDGREWYYLNSPSGARWQQSGNLWISKDDGVSWTWMPKGPGTDSLGGSGDSCAAVARDGTIYFSDLLYPATISVEWTRDFIFSTSAADTPLGPFRFITA